MGLQFKLLPLCFLSLIAEPTLLTNADSTEPADMKAAMRAVISVVRWLSKLLSEFLWLIIFKPETTI
jgi:hypothetical protein